MSHELACAILLFSVRWIASTVNSWDRINPRGVMCRLDEVSFQDFAEEAWTPRSPALAILGSATGDIRGACSNQGRIGLARVALENAPWNYFKSPPQLS